MSDPRRLLGGHATDSLTEAERQELLRAALDDQELFDSLVEDEGLRELLAMPGAREEILGALDRPTGWELFKQWLTRPAIVGDLVMVASVLILGFVGLKVYRGVDSTDLPPPAARPFTGWMYPETLPRLYSAAPFATTPVEFERDGEPPPHPLAPGDRLALKVTGQAPARFVVIGEDDDGSVVEVFPPAGRDALLLGTPPGAATRATRSFEVTASRRPGRHRLRLVVAPPSFGIEALRPDHVDKLRALGLISLVDLTYEVAGPGTTEGSAR